MTDLVAPFGHEKVVIELGSRSGLPIVVAVHSTRLGAAAGGCRMWAYPSWRDGLADALRLSEAMSLKCAAAGLRHGGGKSVIVLPDATPPEAERRRHVMLDLGDIVEGLGGTYVVGEDVGVTAEDMFVASERTRYAACLPEDRGGSGEPAEATSVGVVAAIRVTARKALAGGGLQGARVVIVGLGQVGQRVARRLAAEGADLLVADIDPAKRSVAREIGASWIDPAEAIFAECDLLVPAALGGFLTPEVVPRLRTRAIVGPANNQLASVGVADQLASSGVLWAPDFVVNAGGVVYGIGVDIDKREVPDVMAEVATIGDRLDAIFTRADQLGSTPYAVAVEDALAAIGP
jgi:leucine dehydrogenase